MKVILVSLLCFSPIFGAPGETPVQSGGNGQDESSVTQHPFEVHMGKDAHDKFKERDFAGAVTLMLARYNCSSIQSVLEMMMENSIKESKTFREELKKSFPKEESNRLHHREVECKKLGNEADAAGTICPRKKCLAEIALDAFASIEKTKNEIMARTSAA